MTQKIEIYENSLNEQMVAVYENEIVNCYTKERWDELEAAKENGTIS